MKGGAVIRVAINGFGRIGRCLTRLLAATGKDLELVAINSRADIARDVHLFKYDSVHGRFPGTVAAHGLDPDGVADVVAWYASLPPEYAR